MRSIPSIVAAICLMVVSGAVSPRVAAQQQTATALRLPHYDPAAEVLTKGVIGTIRVQTSPGSLRGTYLTLRTGPLSLEVHLGLLGRESVPFQVGDQIEVTGSLVKVGDAQILLAREVRSADHALTVRNPQGLVLRSTASPARAGVQQ